MNEAPYAQYHPRWYRAKISTYWWLGRWPYLRFILRELSSIAVALSVVMTLFLIHAVTRGPEAYAQFQSRMRAPWALAVTSVAFAFVLFHTTTWFNSAARAMVVRVKGKRVPGALIVAANYAAWLVLSGLITWFLLRG